MSAATAIRRKRSSQAYALRTAMCELGDYDEANKDRMIGMAVACYDEDGPASRRRNGLARGVQAMQEVMWQLRAEGMSREDAEDFARRNWFLPVALEGVSLDELMTDVAALSQGSPVTVVSVNQMHRDGLI
jgi:hypothetical protein